MVVFNKLAERTQGLENPMLQLSVSFVTVTVALFAFQGGTAGFPVQSIAPMVFLGLVNTGLGCYLYFSSLGGLKAQTIVVLRHLEPLFAVVLAILILGEPMSTLQLLGAGLVISGALAAELA